MFFVLFFTRTERLGKKSELNKKKDHMFENRQDILYLIDKNMYKQNDTPNLKAYRNIYKKVHFLVDQRTKK